MTRKLTTADELMLSILAMDPYNQGTKPSVAHGETQIGTATWKEDSRPEENEAAGFAATLYDWNGLRIVSYRGTDNLDTQQSANDIYNGWLAGAGHEKGGVPAGCARADPLMERPRRSAWV